MLSTAKRLKTRRTKRSLVWHVQQKSTKSPLLFYTHQRVCIQKLTRIRKHTNKEERLAFVQMHRYITTAPYVRKSPLPATMLIVKVFTEFLWLRKLFQWILNFVTIDWMNRKLTIRLQWYYKSSTMLLNCYHISLKTIMFVNRGYMWKNVKEKFSN